MGKQKYNLEKYNLELLEELEEKYEQSNENEPEISLYKNEVNELLKRNYDIKLVFEDGYYIASCPDLKGCIADGETTEEAIENLKDAKESWFYEMLDSGMPIPEDHVSLENYSGKILFRIPKSLQHKVTMEANKDGVSINQKLIQLTQDGLNAAILNTNLQRIEKRVEAIDKQFNTFENLLNKPRKGEKYNNNDLLEIIKSFSYDDQNEIQLGERLFNERSISQFKYKRTDLSDMLPHLLDENWFTETRN